MKMVSMKSRRLPNQRKGSIAVSRPYFNHYISSIVSRLVKGVKNKNAQKRIGLKVRKLFKRALSTYHLTHKTKGFSDNIYRTTRTAKAGAHALKRASYHTEQKYRPANLAPDGAHRAFPNNDFSDAAAKKATAIFLAGQRRQLKKRQNDEGLLIDTPSKTPRFPLSSDPFINKLLEHDMIADEPEPDDAESLRSEHRSRDSSPSSSIASFMSNDEYYKSNDDKSSSSKQMPESSTGSRANLSYYRPDIPSAPTISRESLMANKMANLQESNKKTDNPSLYKKNIKVPTKKISLDVWGKPMTITVPDTNDNNDESVKSPINKPITSEVTVHKPRRITPTNLPVLTGPDDSGLPTYMEQKIAKAMSDLNQSKIKMHKPDVDPKTNKKRVNINRIAQFLKSNALALDNDKILTEERAQPVDDDVDPRDVESDEDENDQPVDLTGHGLLIEKHKILDNDILPDIHKSIALHHLHMQRNNHKAKKETVQLELSKLNDILHNEIKPSLMQLHGEIIERDKYKNLHEKELANALLLHTSLMEKPMEIPDKSKHDQEREDSLMDLELSNKHLTNLKGTGLLNDNLKSNAEQRANGLKVTHDSLLDHINNINHKEQYRDKHLNDIDKFIDSIKHPRIEHHLNHNNTSYSHELEAINKAIDNQWGSARLTSHQANNLIYAQDIDNSSEKHLSFKSILNNDPNGIDNSAASRIIKHIKRPIISGEGSDLAIHRVHPKVHNDILHSTARGQVDPADTLRKALNHTYSDYVNESNNNDTTLSKMSGNNNTPQTNRGSGLLNHVLQHHRNPHVKNFAAHWLNGKNSPMNFNEKGQLHLKIGDKSIDLREDPHSFFDKFEKDEPENFQHLITPYILRMMHERQKENYRHYLPNLYHYTDRLPTGIIPHPHSNDRIIHVI